MKVTARSRRAIRVQNVLFVLLFLTLMGVLAVLSLRYHYVADWTANSRNSLSPASVSLLQALEAPVEVTAFVSDTGPLKGAIATIIGRYQRYKPDVTLAFVNPDLSPEQVREAGVTVEGELLIDYQGRRQRVRTLTEQGITNVLYGLSRAADRWVVFVEGHGERSPFGRANHDVQVWARELEGKGFNLKGLNLAETPSIPQNTSVLVIAGPQVDYLPGEMAVIERFVANGGNLLWLTDPGGTFGLEPLAELLGVSFVPGIIIDPATRLMAGGDPTIAIVGDYGIHPLTSEFDISTLFPAAVAIAADDVARWRSQPFLTTDARTWSEAGALMGEVGFDAGSDVAGPLVVGLGLSRAGEEGADENEAVGADQQRVVIVGDGDFLSNRFLGNGGNLDLGMRIINWLSSDDALIRIPASTALDASLVLSDAQIAAIGFGFLLVLPLVLLGGGVAIWWRRRKA